MMKTNITRAEGKITNNKRFLDYYDIYFKTI